jgi:CRP/FNR family transcriptional regulator
MGINRLKVDCRNCGLYRLCLLPQGLNASDRERLESIVECRVSIRRGESLYSAGDRLRSIYAIRSGSVKTCVPAPDGRQQISGFHLPGEILGLEAIHAGYYYCTTEAMESTSVCEIPYVRYEELARRLPTLHERLLKIMSNEIGYAQILLMPGHKRSARAQLAIFLLNLSNRLRQQGFSDSVYHLRMSRGDLANYLGVSMETLCRLFARLQEEGILRIQRRRVHLLDLPALRNIAGIPDLAGVDSHQIRQCANC